MLSLIYPYLFLAALSFGILGTLINRRHAMAKMAGFGFLVSVALYILTVINVEASIGQKIFASIRDAAVLHLIIYTFAKLKFFKKIIPFAIGAVVIGMSFFYTQVLKHTYTVTAYPKKTINPAINDIANKKYRLAENGELLIDITDKAKLGQLVALLGDYDVSLERAFPTIAHEEATDLDDFYTLDIPTKHLGELADIKKTLAQSGLTDWVEENENLTLDQPNNASIAPQKKRINYGINDPGLDSLWSFEQMKMQDLYSTIAKQKIKPKKKAKIAILDTGVDNTHEDLKANFFTTDRKSNIDKQGHGTHCAGIACAVSNNKVGIASFAPDNSFVEVTSVKVLNDWGMGTQKSIIDGIIKAADAGVDVISMSLGGPARGDSKQKAYNAAFRYANRAGAIVVVAAGNSNRDATEFAPAVCKNVIVVSAVDPKLDRAVFSNMVNNIEFGIAAPGVNIYSTLPGNKYARLSGTSMATPYVAGLVGMMKSINPNLTTQQTFDILKNTGIETGDTRTTGRFIQPVGVVESVLSQALMSSLWSSYLENGGC